MKTSRIRWKISGSLALAGLMLVGVGTDAQARPRPKYRAARPVNAQIWIDAPYFRAGHEVRFTVTVDRPGFVTVFRVDANGRRYRLTSDPGGVWVTPHQPLRAPGPQVMPVFTSEMCGPQRLIVVARDRAFRSASEYFSLAFAPTGFHGDCGVASCTFDVVPGPPHRTSGRASIGVWLGGLDFHVGSRARVYVNGLFCGLGPAALNMADPGVHRVTVVTEAGQKYSRSVYVPASLQHYKPARAERPRGRHHP